MSDDYISGLRRDLVEAAAREQQAGRAAHVVRPLHPRAWSPLAVLGAAATVAALLLVVVTLRAVNPPREPSAARIVETVDLGGQPADAVAVGGSVVVADYAGDVTQIDARDPDVRTLLKTKGETVSLTEGTPICVAARGNTLWILSAVRKTGHAPRYNIDKIETGSGRYTLVRRRLDHLADAVATGATGLWLPPSILHLGDLGGPAPAIDPTSGLGVEGVVVGEREVWVRRGDAVIELDRRGRVVNRVDGISPVVSLEAPHSLLPDADGAWVSGQDGGLLYRVEDGRVVRRVKVGETAGALARTGSTVWVGATSSAGNYELVRVDADDARVTGRLSLGRNAPQSIVPVGKRLWVITSGGAALVVNPE